MDLLSLGDGPPERDEEVEWEHAARDRSPRTSDRDAILGETMRVLS